MRITRTLVLATLLFGALGLSSLSGTSAVGVAHAQGIKIATVDFQKAIDKVKDGEEARAKLESLMQQKRGQVEMLGKELEKKQAEYEQQALILSDAARQQKEQELYQAQMQYQQIYMQSEGEVQQMYAVLMEDLITKMRDIAETVAKEKGYDLVLEVTEGGVVYSNPTIDITDELIKRYDAQNGG